MPPDPPVHTYWMHFSSVYCQLSLADLILTRLFCMDLGWKNVVLYRTAGLVHDRPLLWMLLSVLSKWLVSLLGRWLHQLSPKAAKLLINTFHGWTSCDFLENWHPRKCKLLLPMVKLLGTAGTFWPFLLEGSTGLLIHADNAMDGDLSGLLFVMKTVRIVFAYNVDISDRSPKSCGIIVTNSTEKLLNSMKKLILPKLKMELSMSPARHSLTIYRTITRQWFWYDDSNFIRKDSVVANL